MDYYWFNVGPNSIVSHTQKLQSEITEINYDGNSVVSLLKNTTTNSNDTLVVDTYTDTVI